MLAAFLLPIVFAGPQAAPNPAVGGSAEDYARAASMRETARAALPNETLAPIWVSGSRVVYRLGLPRNFHRYLMLDAPSGTLSAAFDHEHVAARLRDMLGDASIDADRLPITHVWAVDGALLAALPSGLDIRIDTRTSAVEPLGTAVLVEDPRVLERVRARRSRDRGGDTSVRFINGAGVPVRLVWLDRNGAPQRYGLLEPGEWRSQHTFAGHVWRVETTEGRSLGVYRAAAAPRVVRIDDQTADQDEEDAADKVFVRNRDLWLRSSDGAEQRLTTDGTADDAYTTRVTWSPDQSKLVVIRTTPAQNRRVHLIDSAPDDRLQPKPDVAPVPEARR